MRGKSFAPGEIYHPSLAKAWRRFHKRLLELAEEELPVGVDLKISGHPLAYAINDTDIMYLSCDGEDVIMNMYCCMPPGHEGDCYSAIKNDWFRPERKSQYPGRRSL